MTTTEKRWIKSEDAGHGAGAMLLDMPAGHWSVRRANGRRWVAALVKGGIAVWSREFQTRREAMEFAEGDAAAARKRSSLELEVEVGHRSSIAGARWCRPVGWTPRNVVEGADWSDGDGCWQDVDGEAAGIVIFGHDEEGDRVAVGLDDLRVASCGECRVIDEVIVDFV